MGGLGHRPRALLSRGDEAARSCGSDNDLEPYTILPMKRQHPQWLIHTWEGPGYWNFTVLGVRAYKLEILREIAEKYDFDGMELDFSRCPVCLPHGHQGRTGRCSPSSSVPCGR